MKARFLAETKEWLSQNDNVDISRGTATSGICATFRCGGTELWQSAQLVGYVP